jgi:hypothetical protein
MSLKFFRNPHAQRAVSVLTGIAFAGSLLLSACGGGATSSGMPQQSSAVSSVTKLPASGKAPMFKAAQVTGTKTSNRIAVTATSAPGTSTVQLQLPADADAESLAVTLNGKDISGLFMASACTDGECMKATVSASDGYAAKNVVNANVRKKTGGMASGRVRFAAGGAAASVANAIPASQATALSVTPKSVANATDPDAVCDTTAMCPPWLAPSVTFNTLTPEGWVPNKYPWIEVNGQKLPGGTPSASCFGSAKYVVVVLDRQTLVEKTTAPESSPQCFSDSPSLTTALGNLPANDLVIVGTMEGQVADAQMDTTPIGGSKWAKAASNLVPVSYMAIGAGRQPSGSAYENYDNTTPGAPQFNVFATGTLQEDANGNYAFQSSDIVEYAVSPNDPGYFIPNTTGSVIAMNLPADLTDDRGALRAIYTLPVPNTPTAPFNGLWLLILDRITLQPSAGQPCLDSNFTAPGVLVQPCGNTYAVSKDVSPSTADANWKRLYNDLGSLGSAYQLAILVSVNTVGNTDQPTTFQSVQQSQQHYPSFPKFAAQLQNFGGTYTLIAGPLYANTDSYSLVGFSGAGNALVGGAAEASTQLQNQGQLGVLHGTLQRNRNGLYQPGQTSQEPQTVFAAKGGLDDSDFAMAVASFQQSVAWPSNDPSKPLPGATPAGQQAAYRFISHWLLAGYYLKGIAGPHQDDLHYFFSGSSNTWIDYHTMDPANLPFPATGTWTGFGCITSTGSTCTLQAPGDSAPTSFTAGDFNAVKAQMSLEVQYLTNTLQFLVTGSTNMKDVVAAGNANVGLALTGAAATILGSKFASEAQLSPTAQVGFSWQSLLGLIGGIASTIANAEGVGELLAPDAWAKASPTAQKTIKNGVGIANTIGALLATIGSGGSLKTANGAGPGIPQPFVQFTTTIGQLANGELQSQLIVGFDVLADNLTSDWARLQSIGSRVVDVNDPLYAPNQVSQNTALQALTNAAGQSFYFSLLPSFYHIDVWPGVQYRAPGDTGAFQPGIGSGQGDALEQTCHAFYVSPNTAPLGYLRAFQGMAPATVGAPLVFNPDLGPNDIMVIAGPAQKPNTKSTFIPAIPIDLATILFAPDQLNISMQQFVAANGPMPQNVATQESNPSGWGGDICDVQTSYIPGEGTPVTPLPGKDMNGNTITSTTLTSATSNTLGQDTVLTAVVKAGDQPVTGGIVYFSIDGQVVGKATVGADGTATLTLPEATLGKHSVQADYAPPNGYGASSTAPTTLGVYAGSPDLTVAAASTSLDVSYDKPSAPLAVTIGSVAGMAGDVQLSCTGLPAGMSCKFDTPTPTLAADGSVQVSVVIGPSVATEAALGLLLLPMLIIGWRREDGSVRRRALPALLALCMAATALTGCSGDSSSIPRETGTKTVLINATVGGVSRSVAVDVHID